MTLTTTHDKKELTKPNINEQHDLSIIEQVVMQGDLSKLNPEQRVTYYRKVCESAGLNPYTRPFDYLSLNGKLTLYAKKDATEQLRKVNGISIVKLEGNVIDDLYIVKATATTKDGRTDEATGAVTIGNLRGDAKANAIMKAETKAKRRVTLSISGMGWTDETEIETIPNAKMVQVDIETGELEDKLSIGQVQELTTLLGYCSTDYVAQVWKVLKQPPYMANKLDDVPRSLYEKIKLGAIKNATSAIVEEPAAELQTPQQQQA